MKQNYFLISKTDAFKVRQVLEEAIASYPHPLSRSRFEDILHDLDSGLHITDAVPTDFSEEGDRQPLPSIAKVSSSPDGAAVFYDDGTSESFASEEDAVEEIERRTEALKRLNEGDRQSPIAAFEELRELVGDAFDGADTDQVMEELRGDRQL